jgi:hypothetical protein
VIFEGACHCGAIQARFETSRPPEDIQVRACQCSFCRRRGGKTVSDPAGLLTFRAAPGKLHRYRFGTGTADFLICRDCGGYVGVVQQIEGKLYGVLNVTGTDIRALADRSGEPMDYAAEDVDRRSARRRRVWSPAELAEG